MAGAATRSEPRRPGAAFGRLGRLDGAAAPAIAIAQFAVYALTAPRTVTLEDDGLFIMAAVDAGVAHPPGYPLYTLIGHLFSYLPIDPPAWRLHLLSGLLGAAACAVLYLIARRLRAPPWAAAAAAFAWGLSEHFWSQALIAEVYTLNALLCALVFYFLVDAAAGAETAPGGRRGMPRGRSLDLAALCFGLGVANHWPLMVLAGPGFALLMLPHWAPVLARAPRMALISLAAAAPLYGWMLWRSHAPVIAFYGPLESLSDFWYYFSRKGYAGVDSSETASALDTLSFAGLFLRELLAQATPVGAALAVAGLVCGVRGPLRMAALGSLGILFAHSIALIFMLDFDFEDLIVAVFRPYPITAYGFWALWMGVGLGALANWKQARGGRGASSKRVGRLAPRIAAIAAAALIPAYLLASNLRVNDRSADDFAGEHARFVLNSLPPDAVFLTFGDFETGPMGYLHHVENVRPDVELISLQGLVFPNRIFPVLLARKRSARHAAIMEFVAANRRPLFVTSRLSLPQAFGGSDFGLYHQVDIHADTSVLNLQVAGDMHRYLLTLDPYADSEDLWIRQAHGLITHRVGKWLGYAALSNSAELAARVEDLHAMVAKHFHGITGMAEVLVQHGQGPQLEQARQLLGGARGMMEEGMGKERHGRYHYLQGFLAYRTGDLALAKDHFAKSYAYYPSKDNPSGDALRTLGG